MNVRTILINPHTRSLTEHYIDRLNFKQIHALLDCEITCLGPVFRSDYDTMECLMMDDTGLYRDNQAFFTASCYPYPLAGIALLAGFDADGDMISASLSIEELEEQIHWIGLDDVTKAREQLP